MRQRQILVQGEVLRAPGTLHMDEPGNNSDNCSSIVTSPSPLAKVQ